MLLKFAENFDCVNYLGLVLRRSEHMWELADGPQTPNSGDYELEVVADEDEGGPVVGVGEGVDGELSGDEAADSSAIDRFGVF